MGPLGRAHVAAREIPARRQHVATPLAGLTGMSRLRFLLWDAAGTACWAGASLTAGFLLRREAQRLLDFAQGFAPLLAGLAVALLAVYLGVKYIQRRSLLARHRMARIQPEELRRRMLDGDPLIIIDLRSRHELNRTLATLPGALWLSSEEVDRHASEWAGLGELIFYCS